MRTDHPYRGAPALRPLFLVDDEETDRAQFGRLLRESNVAHPLHPFAQGETIIDALIGVLRGATLPLACFLDVRMPGMNGFDVLRWIRCQRPLDDMAVVMLSSSDELAHLHEAMHFGAQCYLAKFPPPDQIAQIVREAERAAEATAGSAFRLPCNLLLNTPLAVS